MNSWLVKLHHQYRTGLRLNDIIAAVALLFCTNYHSAAQVTPVFSNEEESKQFNSLINTGSADMFNLHFSAGLSDISGLGDARRRVDQFINERKAAKAEFRKSKHVQKLVFDVYEKFFKRYEVNTDMSRLFLYGNFNEYTSTFLYAYIFEQLGIRCSIDENVFFPYISVVVGDDTTEIKITSNNLSEVILKGEQEELIRFWIKTGQTTLEQWHQSGTEELFERICNQKRVIGARELAGLQYINIFRRNFRTGLYLKALEALRLSKQMYPKEEVDHYAQLALNQLEIEKHKYSWTTILCQRIIFYKAYSADQFERKFGSECRQNIFSTNNASGMDTIYEYLNPLLIPDSSILNQLKANYYRTLGQFYFEKGRLYQALVNFKLAREFAPDDVDIDYGLYSSFRDYYEQLISIPSGVNVKDIELMWSFGKIKSDRNYQSEIVELTYRLVNRNMQLNAWKSDQLDIMAGVILENIGNSDIGQHLQLTVADIYIDLAYTYVKQGNKVRAKEIINEAYGKYRGNQRVDTAYKFYVENH